MKLSDLKNYKVVGTQATAPQSSKQTGIADIAQGVSDFFGANGITQQFGADIARATVPEDQKNLITYPSAKKVLGSAIQTGANLIPGVGKGATLLTKAAVGAGTGYAFDVGSNLQNDAKNPGMPGVGTVVGGGLPIATAIVKPAARIVGRLFKGLASGLSGVSTGNIDTILQNPQEAAKVSQELAKSGNEAILEKNARQIVDGVSKVRQEARQAFGEGVQQLKAEDINPTTFRQSIQSFLDKNGVSSEGNTRFLDNVEFNDPKNLQVASNLIDEVSKAPLDGYSLRKVLNKVENTRFKTATSDERLAFNAFTKDFAGAIKQAITDSTDKLGQINQAFSQDMQLSEAVQNIFGKVNFKNLPEVVRASQRLETLFSKKGLAPDVIDQFLTRIGVSPADFRTSEAVRQISQQTNGGNSVGLSLGEIAREVTSAVITPQMVKQIAIFTGLAEQKVRPFLDALKAPARNIVIQALLQAGQGGSK
jgi:hypothetical protein